MLETVSLHQTRFNAPGIAPDARGIALGKQGVVLLGTLDGLVGWFRVLSDEMPLDDILPSLAIHEVRSALESLAFLVVFHAESSYLVDRAARIASLLGGTAFTGTGKHLVKYRDPSAPLGYDIDALSPEAADFVLYTERYTQPFRHVREVPFSQLVFRLSARRVAGRDRETRETLWLTVAPGLARGVLAYLHRNRVENAAAMAEREGQRSAFGEARGSFPPRYLLVRVRELPDRMIDLFEAVPGIAVYRPVTDNVLVEVGYRHPLHLESCRSVFDKARTYIFSGRRDALDVIAGEGAGPLALVEGERLIAVGFDLGAPLPKPGEPVPAPARPAAPPTVQVSLRLVPTTAPPCRVTCTMLGWEHVDQLRKLVFALPPTVLAGCRVAMLVDGLVVIGSGGVEALPIGEPYYETAPSIYLPLGTELLPRVSEQVLAEHVGGVDGRRVFFRRGAARPIAVAESDFEALSRRVVGPIDVELREGKRRSEADDASGASGAIAAASSPDEESQQQVINDPAGAFPLWGYRLPPGVG